MTNSIKALLAKTLVKTSLLLIAVAALGACGQKGPLVIEEPPLEQVTTQKEEPAETK